MKFHRTGVLAIAISLSFSTSYSHSAEVPQPETLAAFGKIISEQASSRDNSSSLSQSQLSDAYNSVRNILDQMQAPLNRLKGFVYALANYDLGSNDQFLMGRFGQAALIGYSLRAGAGKRSDVERIYPLILLQAHIDMGIGGGLSGSVVSDRRAKKPAFGLAKENDMTAGFLLMIDGIQDTGGEGPAYEQALKDTDAQREALKERIRAAEQSGRLVPAWKFWRRQERTQQLEALQAATPQDARSSLERFGTAREGEGFGIGFGFLADLIGLKISLPISFASVPNSPVRNSFQRTLAILANISELGRTGRIVTQGGLEQARILVTDLNRSVQDLDNAIRSSSSYSGYSQIPLQIGLDEETVFSTPLTLVKQSVIKQPVLQQLASSHDSVRSRACTLLLEL